MENQNWTKDKIELQHEFEGSLEIYYWIGIFADTEPSNENVH